MFDYVFILYAKQLFIALKLMRRCKIIHADLKPDNVLLSKNKNLLKVCDLGSAFDVTENETTSYLVSRWYRAPEVCLGAKYDTQIDVWAAAVSVYEIYTGEVLFKGDDNNHMLKLIFELRGKPSNKVIKSGAFWKKHFSDDLDFQWFTKDKGTRKEKLVTMREMNNSRPLKNFDEKVLAKIPPERRNSTDPNHMAYMKKVRQFADLLNKCLVVDPEKRYTPDEALMHPFIREPWPTKQTVAGAK